MSLPRRWDGRVHSVLKGAQGVLGVVWPGREGQAVVYGNVSK
jgi:hypothetical protein